MRVQATSIPGVLVLQPQIFEDERGLFFESFNSRDFAVSAGVAVDFVQDNHSKSACHVLRGLHYQIHRPQGRLVRVIHGAVLDVAVDLRRSSKTFGCHVKVELSAENKRQMWIPPGFAHGFLALDEATEVLYKTTDYYAPKYERCIRWDDPDLAIDWGLDGAPILSAKDLNGSYLSAAEVYD